MVKMWAFVTILFWCSLSGLAHARVDCGDPIVKPDQYIEMPEKMRDLMLAALTERKLDQNFRRVKEWTSRSDVDGLGYDRYGFKGNYNLYMGKEWDVNFPMLQRFEMSMFHVTSNSGGYVDRFTIGRQLGEQFALEDVTQAVRDALGYDGGWDSARSERLGLYDIQLDGGFKYNGNYFKVVVVIGNTYDFSTDYSTTVQIQFLVETFYVEKYLSCIKKREEEERSIKEKGKNLKL